VDGNPRALMKLPKLPHVTFTRWNDDKTHSEKIPTFVPPLTGLTPDAVWIYTVDDGGHLFVMNPQNSNSVEPVPELRVQNSPTVTASGNGHMLAFADSSNTVSIIDLTVKLAAIPVATVDFDKAHNWSVPVVLTFSPDNKWLVARTTFGNAFVIAMDRKTWPQAFPSLIAPYIGVGSASPFTFDPTVSFVAGTVKGQLYIWPLNKPPRGTARPVYTNGESFERAESVFFCHEGKEALVSGQDGSVQAVQLVDGLPLHQVARLSPGHVRFAGSTDGHSVFAFDETRIVSGPCGNRLDEIWEHESDIVGLTSDKQGGIVVVGTDDIVRLNRVFYLWAYLSGTWGGRTSSHPPTNKRHCAVAQVSNCAAAAALNQSIEMDIAIPSGRTG
jgi:hypothetical protein